MTVIINGTTGISSPEVVIDNTSADGGQTVLKSSGFSDWNLDNYNGRLRAYNGSTERMTIDTSGNVGIGTSSPVNASGYTIVTVNNATNGSGAYYQKAGTTLGRCIAESGNFTIGAIAGGGNLIFESSGTTERMRIDSSGDVAMGITSSVNGARLTVRSKQTDFSGNCATFQNGNNSTLFAVLNDGQINTPAIFTGTGTALVLDTGGNIRKSSSSIRYKKDVEPIDIGLDFVIGLKPVKYNIKDGDVPQVGFIAEEFPDTRLVSESLIDIEDPSKGLQREGVNYANLVAPLVKAIQEQQAIITELKAELDTVKAEVTALKGTA